MIVKVSVGNRVLCGTETNRFSVVVTGITGSCTILMSCMNVSMPFKVIYTPAVSPAWNQSDDSTTVPVQMPSVNTPAEQIIPVLSSVLEFERRVILASVGASRYVEPEALEN